MKDSHKDRLREAKKLRYLSTIYIINNIENAYKNCILIFSMTAHGILMITNLLETMWNNYEWHNLIIVPLLKDIIILF